MAQKVALFIPCFVDQFSPQVGLDTARVLERIGYEPYFSEEQTCCGQPAFNTGNWDEARPLAERFIRVFSSAEAVVCPSGSCVTMVRNFYPELLQNSPAREEAIALGKRVFEFTEFLIDVAKQTDVGAAFPHRVTLHDSCHALRELGIKSGPRELLRKVRGLELVELRNSEDCCGFGGMFSVKFGAISSAMGDSKAENVAATAADYVTSVDSSCLLHLDGILRRRNDTARTIHLASILAQEAR
jgi:L-lactate dehydrogenase complex protein LldE